MTTKRWCKSAIALAAALGSFSAPAAAIVGDDGDGGTFADRVVMILTRGPEGSGYCSGVVLSPRVILTAAHCLRPTSDLLVHYRDSKGVPVIIPVEAAIPHPQFHPDAMAKRVVSVDIGLIKTQKPLPSRFRGATLADSDESTPGEAVTVAGFGLAREGEPKTGGTLRAAALKVREPLSKILLWAAPGGTGGTGGGACSGDSGGPIFNSADNSVVAIVAWTKGEGARKCGSLTQGALIAPLRTWITATIARLQP